MARGGTQAGTQVARFVVLTLRFLSIFPVHSHQLRWVCTRLTTVSLSRRINQRFRRNLTSGCQTSGCQTQASLHPAWDIRLLMQRNKRRNVLKEESEPTPGFIGVVVGVPLGGTWWHAGRHAGCQFCRAHPLFFSLIFLFLPPAALGLHSADSRSSLLD